MLTLATLGEFKRVKLIEDIPSPEGDRKIKDYLIRATRYINRFSRREFFPRREKRHFPIPHSFLDLRMRRFPAADLYMDDDLLEAITVRNANGSIIDPARYFLLPNNVQPAFAIAIKWPEYWGGLYSINDFMLNYETPVIEVDGIWGYHDAYNRPNQAWIDTFAVLTADMNTTDLTAQISNTTGEDAWGLSRFEEGYLLKLDDEFMELTSITAGAASGYAEGMGAGFDAPGSLGVLRAVNGTSASTHPAGTKIYRWRVIDDISEACIQIARTWREADTAAGGRLGVSDVSAGVEIAIPADPARVVNSYSRSIMGQQL